MARRRWGGALLRAAVLQPAGMLGAMGALVAMLLLASAAAGPARADSEMQSILNQIEMLRQQLATTRAEMQDLQRTVYSGAPAPEGAASAVRSADSGAAKRLAIVETRVDEYDMRMRQMFGRFDELSNQIQRLGGRIEKLVADVDFRLNALESAPARAATAPARAEPQVAAAQPSSSGDAAGSGTGGGSVAVEAGQGYKPSEAPRSLGTIPLDSEAPAVDQPAAVASVEPAPALPAGSPEDQYGYAMSLMQQMQWDKADLAFEAFIAQNTGHPLVENAAYWRGESFYARRMFGDAARLYALNFQQYPQGGKASANLVKLALSLVNLERYPEACQAFDKLAQDFPQMPANVRQAAQRGRAQAGCP